MLVEKERGKLENTDFDTLWEICDTGEQKMYDSSRALALH